MRKSITFIILFIVTCIHPFEAQNETQKWVFGGYAALNFATNPPSALSGSSLTASEGCASISDDLGNLLFYSDGNTVFNKAHVAMANGGALFGSTSSSQSTVIVKKLGSNKQYYLFTLDGSEGNGDFLYSVVDMNLAAGMGSVTIKNVLLSDSIFTEKLAAVKHCNGIDTWVVVNQHNFGQFRAYRVGAAGVNPVPVKSNTGVFLGAQGCMKISPTGKKLGFARVENLSSTNVGIFDFDASTGIVSNPLILGSCPNAYGCEFSADGTKFYCSSDNQLLQWDLCAGSDSAIAASQTTVGATANAVSWVLFGSMQLAQNGKIYVVEIPYGQSLGVINNPNAAGNACSFSSHTQSIGAGFCTYGLPNFVSSYFKPMPLPITFTQSPSGCKNVSFTAPAINTVAPSCNAQMAAYTGFKWIFGDPASGVANTSTLSNPTHTFSNSGSFNVKIVLYTACGTDTIRKNVIVGCVGIGQNYQEPEFSTFPNPVTNQLTVVNTIPGEFEVSDLLGNINLKVFIDKGTQTLNVEQLNNGIYFLRNAKSNSIVKIIKSP